MAASENKFGKLTFDPKIFDKGWISLMGVAQNANTPLLLNNPFNLLDEGDQTIKSSQGFNIYLILQIEKNE
jgi:hypothetical protein